MLHIISSCSHKSLKEDSNNTNQEITYSVLNEKIQEQTKTMRTLLFLSGVKVAGALMPVAAFSSLAA